MYDSTEIFMRTEASRIDKAFDVPSVFDHQRAAFRKPRPLEALQQSLNHYQALGLQPQLRFDIKDCTWDDLLDMISTSRQNYEKKAAGLKGLFRKALRKAGDNSVRIAPLFEMIPGDEGLSVLRGGLGWILTLARESAKKRERIFSAFESIPETFIMAMEKRKIFPESRQLQEKVARLHAMLVEAIMQLAGFLLREHRGESVKAKFPFINIASSGNDVSRILENIDFQCQSLIRYVNSLTEAAVVDTNRMVSSFPKSFEKIESLLEDIKQEQISAVEHYMAMSEQFSIDAQTATRPLLLEMVSEIRRGCEFLELQAKETRLLQNIALVRSLTPSYSITGGVMSVEHLLTALSINSYDTTHDLTIALRAGQQFGDEDKLRANNVIENDRFKRLCYSNLSGSLLIEGGVVHNLSSSRISLLSTVCASVVAGMTQARPDAILLFFMCGLHSAPHDDLRGPSGIMRTILSRVLIELAGRGLANLDFIETRPYRQDLEAHEITALCHAFKNLVRQFPLDTVIYCILDGVGWCEQQQWAQDLQIVMNTLHELVQDQRLRPIFKILVTSPMRCRYISGTFPMEDRVSMDAIPAFAARGFKLERYLLLDKKKAEYLGPKDESSVYVSEEARDDDFYT